MPRPKGSKNSKKKINWKTYLDYGLLIMWAFVTIALVEFAIYGYNIHINWWKNISVLLSIMILVNQFFNVMSSVMEETIEKIKDKYGS